MIKKQARNIIKFLDKHRLVLIVLILLFVSFVFLGINSIIFLNHKFEPLVCTKDLDEIYCYNNDLKIFKDPEKSREKFFLDNEAKVNEFISNHKLPEFNIYTAYYFNEASSLDYLTTGENEEFYNFFNTYINSYNLKNFYRKYNFYYDIFYYYKMN